MSRVSSKIIIGAVVAAALFGLIQFKTVDRTNPPVEADLVAPAAVKDVLRRACYDCHSHETRWPWYSRLVPVSWWLAEHVQRGRADLNFSQWPLFDTEVQGHFLRDIEKQLEDGTMPLRSYLLGHPDARLTSAEKTLLIQWARSGY